MKTVLTAVRTVAGWGMALLAVAFFFLLGSEVGSVPPDNAVVFVDHQTGLYYAPDCPPDAAYQDAELMRAFRELRAELGGHEVWQGLVERSARFEVSTYGAVRSTYEPEGHCKEKGAFFESHSWPVYVLRRLGLWPGPRSRWNPDGTWNWDSSLW